MIVEGTKNGEILRGLCAARNALCSSSMVSRPPMPEPVMTPARSRSSGVEVEPGVGHRLRTGRDAVVHELVHAPRFLGRQVLLELEVTHRTAEVARKGTHVEARDRRDTADAVHDIGPRLGEAAAHRRDNTHTRNDYATLAHALLRTGGNGGAVWRRGGQS